MSTHREIPEDQQLWLAALDGSKIGPFPVDEEWARMVWKMKGSNVYGFEVTSYPYPVNYPWMKKIIREDSQPAVDYAQLQKNLEENITEVWPDGAVDILFPPK